MSKKWICPECKSELELDEKNNFKKGDKSFHFEGKCPFCGTTEDENEIDLPKPPSLSKTIEQLGILVLDGSGSMRTELPGLIMTKEDAVSGSVTEFFLKMKESRRESNFRLAVVYFDEAAFRRLGITEAKDINVRDKFKPVRKDGKRTYLYTGLEEAEKIADEFLNVEVKGYRSVIIVIMTDGIDYDMPQAQKVANRIKDKYGEKVKITASAFGTKGIEEKDRKQIMAFLKSLVTDENLCRETASAGELRGFFLDSVSKSR